MKFIDTHIHIDFPNFNKDRADVIKKAQEVGVEKMINVGVNLETSQKSIDLAEKYENIWATVGVHPSDVKEYTPQIEQELFELAKHNKVVAIGEIGLDYFYGKETIDLQKEVCIAQIKMAKELNKPLVIHTRDAGDDLLKILKQENPNHVVIHCFTETEDFAKEVLDMGYMISFTGIMTYPKADDLRQVVAQTPLDRIMIETDCPFLAPQKQRGERNEPAFVVEVAKKIAEIKGVVLEEIAEVTTMNAERFFGI